MRNSGPRRASSDSGRPWSENIYRFNDLELYDVQLDPLEMNRLAMSEKLNRLIETEVGEDREQMLPGGVGAGWELTAATMAP